MADAVLLGRIELGGAAAQIGQVEIRIVTEAVRSARLLEHAAAPDALRDQWPRIVSRTQVHQHGHVRCAAVLGARQIADQARIIGGIGLLSAMQHGIARRIHTRRATQAVDAQARIIGQRGQAGMARRVPGLGQGIFHEGRIRLFGFTHPQLTLGDHGQARLTQYGGELLELARIVRRQHHPVAGIAAMAGIFGHEWAFPFLKKLRRTPAFSPSFLSHYPGRLRPWIN